MVRVAVEHLDAAGATLRLEPAADAGEAGKHTRGVPAVDACQLERGERGGRVDAVVVAAHRELEVERFELLGAYDVGHMRQPLLEQLPDGRTRPERCMVIEIDIQQYRD